LDFACVLGVRLRGFADLAIFISF
jgi:hypothetical protein